LKTAVWKVFLILCVQILFYFGAVELAGFQFSFAFLSSFIFSLLFGGLILERHLIKNAAFFMVLMFNLLFLLIAFFLFATPFEPGKKTVNPEHYRMIMDFKEKTVPSYTEQEKKLIRESFYYLTLRDYSRALTAMESISRKNGFTGSFHSYLLGARTRYLEKVEAAKKSIPNFADIYGLFQKGDYTGFMESLRFFRNNPLGRYFYSIARERMMLLSNETLLEKQMIFQIQEFIKNNAGKNYLEHLFVLFPDLQNRYQEKLAARETEKFTYLDFRGISGRSGSYSNLMCFAQDAEKKEFLVFIEKVVEPAGFYPLWGVNLILVNSQGEKRRIPLAKITSNTVVYPRKGGTGVLRLKGIYNKTIHSLELMKTPMNPAWFTEYREDYPLLYRYVVLPFWKQGAQFLMAFFMGFAICYFTIRYIKTVYPRKLSLYFYILPVLFLVFLSLFYSNLVSKVSEMVFRIL
jgi:hypothetical protein